MLVLIWGSFCNFLVLLVSLFALTGSVTWRELAVTTIVTVLNFFLGQYYLFRQAPPRKDLF